MRVTLLPTLLAHEGGWDEGAILLGPVLVYLVIRHMGRGEPPTDAGEREDDAGETGRQ